MGCMLLPFTNELLQATNVASKIDRDGAKVMQLPSIHNNNNVANNNDDDNNKK